MILTNSIIKVKGEFESKEEIKKYLYSFIEDHPFRKYNQEIADEFGEELFSMTFVPKDTVVLTQRYPSEKHFIIAKHFRDDIIEVMKDIVEYYEPSDPILV
tara:strand:+ start:121 stop:423 length:303 start_codon:yes stop_codon:yes gene_type:complete